MSLALLGPLAREAGLAALAGTIFCLKIAVFLVPALVLYELLAPLPLFARLGRALAPRLARLGMSPACTAPLAAGFFLGIVFGAGIILPIAAERRIGAAEVQSMALFLSTCHAVVEDTLLLALVGARGPGEVALRASLLLGLRLALAIAVTAARAPRA